MKLEIVMSSLKDSLIASGRTGVAGRAEVGRMGSGEEEGVWRKRWGAGVDTVRNVSKNLPPLPQPTGTRLGLVRVQEAFQAKITSIPPLHGPFNVWKQLCWVADPTQGLGGQRSGQGWC